MKTLALIVLLSCAGETTQDECWGVWDTDQQISMEQPASTNHKLNKEIQTIYKVKS